MPDQTAQEALWAEIRAIPDPGSPGVVRRQEAQDRLESTMRLIFTSADPADPVASAAGTLTNIGWSDESGAIRAANGMRHPEHHSEADLGCTALVGGHSRGSSASGDIGVSVRAGTFAVMAPEVEHVSSMFATGEFLGVSMLVALSFFKVRAPPGVRD